MQQFSRYYPLLSMENREKKDRNIFEKLQPCKKIYGGITSQIPFLMILYTK